MRQPHSLLSLLLTAGPIAQSSSGLSDSSLEKHVDIVTLGHSFNPVIAAYRTGYPHHRRTPFAVSPNRRTGYLAYLDASGTGVHVQPINPSTFAAMGDTVTVSAGKEAGGLVAHDDDAFAILTNEISPSSGSDIPIPVIYRFKNGRQVWKTFIGGPNLDSGGSSHASPDINGDLVFSEKYGHYAAYIVVTAYEGWASGHFGDAIRYLDTDGNIKEISGASSSWGCSHNTGIAFEAADAPPFASICAEDQGAIWLTTKGQGMATAGKKISNELTVNGGSNEPMGGMGGSYSALARFVGQDSYIFAWVSRGAVDLTPNDWMGTGYTKSQGRTENRNVAIALFSDKNTLVDEEATSEIGAADGDNQVTWVTEGSNDCSNAHAAAFNSSNALITWEEIQDPICDFEAMGCRGKFAGTFYQLVNSKGEKVGVPVKSTDSFVAGDMVTVSEGRVCWPYISMDWDLSGPASVSSVRKMSFACISTASGSTTPS
ncbi:related to MUC1 Extracellular alpha-1,4-glucan glucosidase [Cephalotrichum gorgonifer]|uniref:Related to MUC1 Extracellular alpha-1,4-glucan glucosidase n=1 Tax=Cephalotrichum gorgonifer TaxID=2041049 RepID=A0AAE8N2J0_9PEZI|nr:related to MUC1 Extracellular alpha-1,4-glucan glucosidase [Cephalotrichum gorgonifer]